MKKALPPVAFAILRAATQVVDLIQAGLSERGFSDVRPAHGFAFVRVSAGDATVTDVAAYLGITKQAASQLVNQLVLNGYLRGSVHPVDRRASLIELTARGWACMRAAEDVASTVAIGWRRELGARSFDEFYASLGSLVTEGPLRPAW